MSKKSVLSILLIIVGISLLIIDNYKSYNNKKEETILLDNYFKNTSSINTIKEDNYIAVLEIPKIKLKKGLYSIDSLKNNVKYNIEILSNSQMPNEVNGNLILAAHSGNGKNAFFNDLVDLNVNDFAYIYYNNLKYTYQIIDIYEIKKNGYAKIIRNNKKNILTMITCNQNNKNNQVVIIAELV